MNCLNLITHADNEYRILPTICLDCHVIVKYLLHSLITLSKNNLKIDMNDIWIAYVYPYGSRVSHNHNVPYMRAFFAPDQSDAPRFLTISITRLTCTPPSQKFPYTFVWGSTWKLMGKKTVLLSLSIETLS